MNNRYFIFYRGLLYFLTKHYIYIHYSVKQAKSASELNNSNTHLNQVYVLNIRRMSYNKKIFY